MVPPGQTLDPGSILAPGQKPKPTVPPRIWQGVTDQGTPIQIPAKGINTRNAAAKALAATVPPGQTLSPGSIRAPGQSPPTQGYAGRRQAAPLQSDQHAGSQGRSPTRESLPTTKPSGPWKLGPLKLPGTRVTAPLKRIGVQDLSTHHFTAEDTARMLDQLRRKEVRCEDVIASIESNPVYNTFSKGDIQAMVQNFLDYLPARMGEALKRRKPNIQLLSNAEMGGVPADFQGDTLRLNAEMLVDKDDMQRLIFHELGHWLDDMIPGMRGAIHEHVRVRTHDFTEDEAPLRADHEGNFQRPGMFGMRDDFRDARGNEYMARRYPGEKRPSGSEIASMICEALSYEPDQLADYLNHRSTTAENGGRSSWRETFFTVMQFVY